MGERTFSSNDVLRIFAEHLDPEEQETVRMFFAEPSDINLQILERLLQLFVDFITLFTSPVIVILVGFLPDLIVDSYNLLVTELSFTRGRLDREIGRIDA